MDFKIRKVPQKLGELAAWQLCDWHMNGCSTQTCADARSHVRRRT